MSAPDNVLVQSNFKSPTGALHNVYGHNEESFDYGLSIMEARVARLAALEQQFAGAGTVAQVIPLAAVQPPAVEAPTGYVTPPAPTPQAAAGGWGQRPGGNFQAATTPSCNHGPRTARSGSSGKGPWKAWMCPTPKGTPDQCSATWVQRGTPEWDAFPA